MFTMKDACCISTCDDNDDEGDNDGYSEDDAGIQNNDNMHR